ncbi:MAG: CCA tRNA nucleotidyltransferase [Bacteroidetes bacterium]|jgi:poly(A) polymerase|nr:tRNA nucleotidyltransferase [Crocinitomicaceae bacterium]MCH9822802.1 CCA tRNA nucleotidyltransferase [Bacteroidota bacterium]MDA7730209.1 CCA tRNA nucleotidyltransferase [Salibacteraceae bacterium]|tara:strand:- start:60737 stop:62146 length:1410 start_codon:yes stop_codon:yes gene_type:complete
MNLKHKLHNPVFKVLHKTAIETGTKAFVVGGFVRDILLKRPNKDIDIVVEGNGIDFAKKVANKLENVRGLSVFKNFGTAMIKLDDYELEFVGARKESYRAESRKPIVEDGSIAEDQERRDFTINAMSISLNDADFGELIDPFDGQKDVVNGILKTPLHPDQTYSDDPLRMMRAIRFASQLHFRIEEGSFDSIKKNQERLSIVSAERINIELNKIMESPQPSVGLELLYLTGIMKQVLPEVHALQGVDEIDGQTHKDNFYHTIEVVDNAAETSDNLWLRWAALLHDIGKPPTKRFDPEIGWTFHGHEMKGAKMVPAIFKRLKLPMNDKMKYVKELVYLSSRPAALSKDIVSDSAVRRLLHDAGDYIDDLMLLVEADITSKNKERVKRYKKNFKEVRVKLKEIEEKDQVRNFQPPVSGEQIMETFNLKPCREIGVLKAAIKEAILEGEIPNEREAAFDFMLKKGKELGLEQ